jgi:hypothetical protein
MSAIWARRSTIECSQGSSSGLTSRAPVVISTIFSEEKYWNKNADQGKSQNEKPRDAGPKKQAHEHHPYNSKHEHGEIIRRVSPVSLP